MSELEFLLLLKDHVDTLIQKVSIKDDLMEMAAMIQARIDELSAPVNG